MKPERSRPRVVKNKQANFNYQTIDTLEVGLVMTGREIKAVRAGLMHLDGSYGRILRGQRQPELWLVGASIAQTEEPQRSLKLLAHRQEINRLIGLVQQKGLTLIPQKVYLKRGRAKLLLAISRGTKEYEKRHKIRARDTARDIARSLAESNAPHRRSRPVDKP